MVTFQSQSETKSWWQFAETLARAILSEIIYLDRSRVVVAVRYRTFWSVEPTRISQRGTHSYCGLGVRLLAILASTFVTFRRLGGTVFRFLPSSIVTGTDRPVGCCCVTSSYIGCLRVDQEVTWLHFDIYYTAFSLWFKWHIVVADPTW